MWNKEKVINNILILFIKIENYNNLKSLLLIILTDQYLNTEWFDFRNFSIVNFSFSSTAPMADELFLYHINPVALRLAIQEMVWRLLFSKGKQTWFNSCNIEFPKVWKYL